MGVGEKVVEWRARGVSAWEGHVATLPGVGREGEGGREGREGEGHENNTQPLSPSVPRKRASL